jgi:hypothetical protein
MVFFCYVSLIYASDDSEYWSSYKFNLKLNEKLSLKLIEEFRMKSDMGNFYTYVQYAGLGYKINDYLDTACLYQLVSSKSNQRWPESHRIDMDLILHFNLDEFKLSNRSRFERNATKSSWLYRDNIEIKRTIELFHKFFTPFISNEFFLDLEPDSGFHENRASVGFSTDFIWGTKLSIYYMARGKKAHGNWNNSNILGTTIDFSF